MSDLIFLAVLVGFFAVAFGLLRFCERIIGPGPIGAGANPTPTTEPQAQQEVTA